MRIQVKSNSKALFGISKNSIFKIIKPLFVYHTTIYMCHYICIYLVPISADYKHKWGQNLNVSWGLRVHPLMYDTTQCVYLSVWFIRSNFSSCTSFLHQLLIPPHQIGPLITGNQSWQCGLRIANNNWVQLAFKIPPFIVYISESLHVMYICSYMNPYLSLKITNFIRFNQSRLQNLYLRGFICRNSFALKSF